MKGYMALTTLRPEPMLLCYVHYMRARSVNALASNPVALTRSVLHYDCCALVERAERYLSDLAADEREVVVDTRPVVVGIDVSNGSDFTVVELRSVQTRPGGKPQLTREGALADLAGMSDVQRYGNVRRRTLRPKME